MNTEFSPFYWVHLSGYSATHPLARPDVRLPLSRLVAGPGLPPRCFALKDSDPLRAKARVGIVCGSHPPRRTIGRVQLRFLG